MLVSSASISARVGMPSRAPGFGPRPELHGEDPRPTTADVHLRDVCAAEGCDFVVLLGDNIYETDSLYIGPGEARDALATRPIPDVVVILQETDVPVAEDDARVAAVAAEGSEGGPQNGSDSKECLLRNA